jgi:thiamine-monophosphate kinase
MGELDFIRWIRQQAQRYSRVSIGIGDDCAAVEWDGGKDVLVTTDMLLEGSCFLLDAGGERIGRKAMAVNLSDMAAMAGEPNSAVVSLGLPRSGGRGLAEDLYRGMHQMGDEFGVVIVGGDTNTWDGPLTISVTLFGEPTCSGPVRRKGAEAGDWLMVTGEMGGSIVGHHLDFTPRVREAQRLHEMVKLKAMIDISDGLAADLHHLCEESGVGAEVVAERVPIRQAAREMKDAKSPLEHALGDGEDFELLFAVSATDGEKLLRDQPLAEFGVNLSRLGGFLSEPGVWLRHEGQRDALPALGYVHRFAGE